MMMGQSRRTDSRKRDREEMNILGLVSALLEM